MQEQSEMQVAWPARWYYISTFTKCKYYRDHCIAMSSQENCALCKKLQFGYKKDHVVGVQQPKRVAYT